MLKPESVDLAFEKNNKVCISLPGISNIRILNAEYLIEVTDMGQ